MICSFRGVQVQVQLYCKLSNTQQLHRDMNHATTKPRLGPPGCILHCCGVVVWSGQQQQHASPCITLSSFLQIPNGSRARVWDAIVAGGLLHSYSLRSCRTFQTTSLSHLLLYAFAQELETNLWEEVLQSWRIILIVSQVTPKPEDWHHQVFSWWCYETI